MEKSRQLTILNSKRSQGRGWNAMGSWVAGMSGPQTDSALVTVHNGFRFLCHFLFFLFVRFAAFQDAGSQWKLTGR
jgi:hypothetical protein